MSLYVIKARLRDLKHIIQLYTRSFRYCIKNGFRFNRGEKPICWHVGVPEHHNMGDHAITIATNKFIRETIPDFDIVEITENKFFYTFFAMKNTIREGDIIIGQGGGNLGDEYFYIETIRRLTISNFKKNKIIIFPQTIYFHSDERGQIEERKSADIYRKHPNITVAAREEMSYRKMKEIFGECAICVPDIVISLLNDPLVPQNNAESKKLLLCIRKDREIATDAHKLHQIIDKIAVDFDSVVSRDTCNSMGIKPSDREKELVALLKEFASAKLVITDRLHGMVFAAITKTPCIALSNYNYKVKGVYKWLSDFDYITFLDSLDDIDADLVQKIIYANKDTHKQQLALSEKFEPVRDKLKS